MSADPPGERGYCSSKETSSPASENDSRVLPQQQQQLGSSSGLVRSPVAQQQQQQPKMRHDDSLARYAALNLSMTSTTEESESSAAAGDYFPREENLRMEQQQQQQQRQSSYARRKSPPYAHYKPTTTGASGNGSPDSLVYSLGSRSNHHLRGEGIRSSKSSPESLAYSSESFSPQVQHYSSNRHLHRPSSGHHQVRGSKSSPDSLTYSTGTGTESFASPSLVVQDNPRHVRGRNIRSRSQQQQQQQLPKEELVFRSESPPPPVDSVTASGDGHAASASFCSDDTVPTMTTLASNEHLMLPSLSMGTSSVQLFSTSNEMRLWQLSELRRQGFPVGLALEVGNTKATYPCRFWVVDNSGSMLTADGNQMRNRASTNDDGRTVVVPCTRWAELQQTVEDHAKLAGLIQVSTVFRMLNDPGIKVGRQEFSIADPDNFREAKAKADKANAKTNNRRHALKKEERHAALLKRSIEHDVKQTVSALRQTRPSGATPLTPHVLDFRNRIQVVEEQLRRQGQQAVVVLATDGLPTDNNGDESEDAKEEFVDALKTLKNLPVWIVIRLCTDDKEVVDYYNSLDKMLELPLEVIDDFLGEAKEIFLTNPWLNYALPMHRCREMGYHHRIFDLLDERPLTKDEVHEFLLVLFGKKAMANAPDIHMDWHNYFAYISCINRAEGKHWRAHSRKQEHWIDMRRLNKLYGTGGSSWLLPHISSWRKGTGNRTAYAMAEI